MCPRSLYPIKQASSDWNNVNISTLQQVTAAVAQARSLDEALYTVLDACSTGLGSLHPSIVLLDTCANQLVGRQIATPQTDEAVRQAADRAGAPVDGLLGLRRSWLPVGRNATRYRDVPRDAVTFQLDMVENIVVRVFLERRLRTATRYYHIVRPYLREEDAAGVQRALGIESFTLLPLIATERCFGVLIVGSSSSHPLADTVMAALNVYAAQVALAAEVARLQCDLTDREHQVSLLLKSIIDAQEEERARICMEIHDGVAQTLAPAFHYLQTLDTPELPQALRASVRKTGTLVRDAIREAREVIASLRPASLDTLGLVATLRYEMDELRQQNNWRSEFDANDIRFPRTVETALYRIIREAVNNVTKHAQATKVVVQIKKVEERIVVEVQDNGVGFDVVSMERDVHQKGVGLLSMRKRAELLSGRFYLTSTRGMGTLVRVEVPLLVHTTQDSV